MKINLRSAPPTTQDIARLKNKSAREIAYEQRYGLFEAGATGILVMIIFFGLFSWLNKDNQFPNSMAFLLSCLPGLLTIVSRLALGESKKADHQNTLDLLEPVPQEITESLQVWFASFEYLGVYLKALQSEGRELMVCEVNSMQEQGFAPVDADGNRCRYWHSALDGSKQLAKVLGSKQRAATASA